MLYKLKNNNKGFTIIEVMIVLAIAALILLIVLLAVPALQRSSRNTQRKNDATAISSAVANIVSNNGGTAPTGVDKDATTTTLVDICGAGGASISGTGTVCTATSPIETAKLGYYKQTMLYDNTASVTSSATVFTPTIVAAGTGAETTQKVSTESVLIVNNENCNATNTGAGSYGSRYIAVFYAIEGGSGNGSLQCIEP